MQRFSQRLEWPTGSNRIARLVERKRARGERLLDLTISNPTEALADYPHAEIADAYGRVADMTYRPDPLGELPAREAVASYYAARGVAVAADDVVLTASTSEAYSFLFKLFCDPGDVVLAPAPSYPLFEYLAALEAVRIAPYRLRYDGAWHLDRASVEAAITPKARAIVAVDPNNPTGSVLDSAEMQALLAMARGRGIPLIRDEVFADYMLGGGEAVRRTPIRALIEDDALSFSLNGLSKAAGMPQMKLGWMVIHGEARARAEARRRLEVIADTYLSVNTPVQRALPELLRVGAGLRGRILARVRRNEQAMRMALEGSAAHGLAVRGGWSAVLQVPAVQSEDAWIEMLLEEHGVLAQPGYFFDMEREAYVVVSLLTEPENFDRGLQVLRRASEL